MFHLLENIVLMILEFVCLPRMWRKKASKMIRGDKRVI